MGLPGFPNLRVYSFQLKIVDSFCSYEALGYPFRMFNEILIHIRRGSLNSLKIQEIRRKPATPPSCQSYWFVMLLDIYPLIFGTFYTQQKGVGRNPCNLSAFCYLVIRHSPYGGAIIRKKATDQGHNVWLWQKWNKMKLNLCPSIQLTELRPIREETHCSAIELSIIMQFYGLLDPSNFICTWKRQNLDH